MQRIHAPVGVPAGPAHQTGINHRAHPLNRQGGFRYIGGNDDAGILPLLHGAILLFRGQRSVKRKNVPAAHPRPAGQQLRRFPDFIHARHEYQHVPAAVILHRLLHGVRRLLPHGRGSHPAAAVADQPGSPVNGFYGILPSVRLQHPAGGAHVIPQAGYFQRGGHHRYGHVRARAFLQVQYAPQGQIPGEAPFVKLIKHHGAHPFQGGPLRQPAFQHAVRHVRNAGAGGNVPFKAHHIPHFLPQLHSAQPGHVARQQARGHPAGLNDDDQAAFPQPGVIHHGGNAGRLAGARGRFQQDARRGGLQRVQQFSADFLNGKGGGIHTGLQGNPFMPGPFNRCRPAGTRRTAR